MKNRAIENAEIRDIDRTERTFVARASTKAPYRGESLLPEGWNFRRFRKNPVMPYSHIYMVEPAAGTIPVVGKSLWEKIDKDGFLFKPKFVDKEFASDLFDLYADDFMHAFSVGYMPLKLIVEGDDHFDELKEEHGFGNDVREMSIDTLLYEISPVVLPADEDALMQALKEDRITSRILRDAIESDLGLRPAGEVIGDWMHWPVRDAKDFVKDSLRAMDISKTKYIRAVIGKLKSDPKGSTKIQKYLFHKDHWTKESAKKWVEEHGKSIDEIEFERDDAAEMFQDALHAQERGMSDFRVSMDTMLREIDALQVIMRSHSSRGNKMDRSGGPGTPVSPFPLGISGTALAEKVGQAVAGEIRRMQGKVD